MIIVPLEALITSIEKGLEQHGKSVDQMRGYVDKVQEEIEKGIALNTEEIVMEKMCECPSPGYHSCMEEKEVDPMMLPFNERKYGKW